MSKNYPDSIPAPFKLHVKLEDAYRRGWNHGHGFACHNVPTIGEKIWSDSLGRVTVDAENIREVHENACYSAEENSRSYSPFEFTAHKFNSAGYDGDEQERDEDEPLAEDLWEAFDAGISDSISADLSEYTDEDYGIEAEQEVEIED